MTANHIASFFQEVRSFNALYWRTKIENEQEMFQKFKVDYENRKPEFEALRKQEAPFFNLFEILNIRHLEETLHTPMLHHLLDPKGSHEQGALYLNAFLKEVLGLSYTYEDIEHLVLHEELLTLYGRIDLILSYIHRGRKKLIIIENKIYAGDQLDQLQRYFNYARMIVTSEQDLLLIYLTPTGSQASTQSMKIAEQERLRSLGVLSEKSYQEDVIPWLSQTIEMTSSEKVKQSIFQYLMTLQSL